MDAHCTTEHPFKGTLNGDGHTVSGLYINDQGLFGVNAGTIKNLILEGSVTGKGNVGGIAGQNNGRIVSCTNKGSVTGKDCVGGITGTNRADGIVVQNVNSGNVTGENKQTVGVIIGKNENTTEGGIYGNYYQKTDTINKNLTGIGGMETDPEGITSGTGPIPEKYYVRGNHFRRGSYHKQPGGTTPGDVLSGLTPEQKEEVNKIAKELNVPVETAKKLQAMAQELGIDMDVLFLTDRDIVNQDSEGDVKGSSFSKKEKNSKSNRRL